MRKPYEVRSSDIAGLGVFATRELRAEERIVEYVGERISHAEANRRYDDASMAHHHTWLFTVNARYCLDAAHKGNDARYINHSCDPNCEAIEDRGRIFIEALRDIGVGEELSYDYAYDVGNFSLQKLRKFYPCACGSKRCRKTIARVRPSKRRVAK